MIVYCVKGLFSLRKRVIKMRTSDKNKRIYDNFHKRRGQSYWWKGYEPVDEENSNTVQEHM
jgi:hypothetical protein